MNVSNFEQASRDNIYYLQFDGPSFQESYNPEDHCDNDILYHQNVEYLGNPIITNKQAHLDEELKIRINLNKNSIFKKHFDSTKCEETKQENTKLGRKRNALSEKASKHNKFSDDNITRKCKHLVIKNAFNFINEKIYKIYKGKIGNGLFIKELKVLNQSQKADNSANFNKNFLTKKLGEIFSDKISGRISNFPSDHNKLLIKKLMNEMDEDKKQYFNGLFNLSFIQCLNHFCGKYSINELEGLKCFIDIKKNIIEKYPDDGEEYFNLLSYYFNNFEHIINNKREKKSSNQKK